MSKLTIEDYHHQQAACDGLCDITDHMVELNPNLMRCVTCPFCQETVDAVLTETTISCPECKVTVNR